MREEEIFFSFWLASLASGTHLWLAHPLLFPWAPASLTLSSHPLTRALPLSTGQHNGAKATPLLLLPSLKLSHYSTQNLTQEQGFNVCMYYHYIPNISSSLSIQEFLTCFICFSGEEDLVFSYFIPTDVGDGQE